MLGSPRETETEYKSKQTKNIQTTNKQTKNTGLGNISEDSTERKSVQKIFFSLPDR